jgi:uncharacterized protein (TIGR00369 family)
LDLKFSEEALQAMRQEKNHAMHTRNRIIEWQDPGAVPGQADGLSLLDSIRAIRDGALPPPPIARLLGFHYVGAEPGEIVIELQPEHSLENSAGTLHTGVAAAMLDAAMSAAAGTLLPINNRAVTLDLKISYLKPLTIEPGPIRAIGRVVDLAKPTAYVTGQIRDGAGSLAAHAVGAFSVITSEQAQSSVSRAISIKPGMWSTIWRTLEAMAD